jgi:hypothetical protein
VRKGGEKKMWPVGLTTDNCLDVLKNASKNVYVQTTIAKIRIKIQKILNTMLKTIALNYLADVAPVLFLRFIYKSDSFKKPFQSLTNTIDASRLSM